MASISLYNNDLLLSVNRELLLINSSDGSSTQSWLTLPPPEQPKKANGASNTGNAIEDASNEPDGEDEQESKSNPNDSNRILHTAISSDKHLLAIATAGEKALYLYRLDVDQPPKLLSRRDLSRTSNAIRFGSGNGLLFVADKTGDCFTYDCLDDGVSAPSKWILAHFSMVLDILPTPSDDFILTCDRDEKIRCTHFPKSNLIESYCLGHTEYVAAIALLPNHSDDLLVSVSGDKTLRIWKYISGTQVLSFDLPAAALKMAIRPIGPSVSHLAVTLFDNDETIVVYEIRTESNEITCKRLSGFTLAYAQDVSSILFDGSGRLVVATISSKETVRLEVFSLDGSLNAYVLDDSEALNESISKVALSVTIPFDSEEIGLLFKKKFDNIIDYHERKKRRIEEKTKTKSI